MRIMPLGDSALRLECGTTADEATLALVRAADEALGTAALPGVVEIVPAYTTLTLYYEPAAVVAAGAPVDGIASWLEARVVERLKKTPKAGRQTGRKVEVPVCYGGEFGPDLERVAATAKLSADEVVRRHGDAEYVVALIGFAPGFPYLLGLPPELATPRLSRPRMQVPVGSVGIAGVQTGIYPLATPGGWNLIGRSPLQLFQPEKNPPTLLQAGDRVKFRAVTPEEFARWDAEEKLQHQSSRETPSSNPRAPSSNHQRSTMTDETQKWTRRLSWVSGHQNLEFGVLGFIGAWVLELGASAQRRRRCA